MDVPTDRPAQIAQTLGLRSPPGRAARLGRWALLAAVAALILLAGWWYFTGDADSATQYQTAEAKRGELVVTVTATGKLEPVNQVDVGSELSGTIRRVEADFNQRVKSGEVLARLDTEQLQARVVQARASLQAAEAKLLEAQATTLETGTRLQRQTSLLEQKLISQEVLDTARAEHARAEAMVASARAQVALNRAMLDADLTNLRKAVIVSPINGIVLSRNIEPGQTVAASFQTPVLFTLAEDLRQMELQVDVDEADVGQVASGQLASFSVDAYPAQRFSARITTVHYAPKLTQDVVTYEAVLSVDNEDLLLRPGMTATADIVVKTLPDVLIIPNAALRFTPPVTQATGSQRSVVGSLLPGPPSAQVKTQRDLSNQQPTHQVWTLIDNQPTAIPVRIGASDGRFTEVVSGELAPGQVLLIDVVRSTK